MVLFALGMCAGGILAFIVADWALYRGNKGSTVGCIHPRGTPR